MKEMTKMIVILILTLSWFTILILVVVRGSPSEWFKPSLAVGQVWERDPLDKGRNPFLEPIYEDRSTVVDIKKGYVLYSLDTYNKRENCYRLDFTNSCPVRQFKWRAHLIKKPTEQKVEK